MAFGDVVQSKTAEALSVTFDSGLTAGNLVVLVAINLDSGTTLGAGTGMSEAVKVRNTNEGDELGIYYRVVQNGDSATRVCAGTGGPYNMVGFEIEGPWEATPFDVAASYMGSNSESPLTSGTTAATSQNDEYAVAAWTERNSAGNVTAMSNSFVELFDATYTYGMMAVGGKILSTTGATSSSATISTGGGETYACIATFKAAGGGGSPALDDSDGFMLTTIQMPLTAVRLY